MVCHGRQKERRTLRSIVVTFALPAEFAAWRSQRKFEKTPEPLVCIARVGDVEIDAVMTGVACRSGDRQLRNLLDHSDLCIASGLAGGLRPEYSVGSVVVAEQVTSARTDSVIVGDPKLIDIARRCGATPVARFVTCSKIINSPVEKRELSKAADVVDMESFHILRLAHESGVPAVAVRAISDSSASEIPFDFNKYIDAAGNIASVRAAFAIVKAPHKIPKLIEFGRQSSQAARNLSHFLDGYVKVLMNELSNGSGHRT